MRSVPILRGLDSAKKLQIKEMTPEWVARRWRPEHVRTMRDSNAPTHSGDAPIFALISSWHEGDIIYASVRHAFEQGANRVLVIDNDSPDETPEEVADAGAEVVLTFTTDAYDEIYKYQLINMCIERLSLASEHDEIWWLLKDADEFTGAAGEEDIGDILRRTSRDCRVVGARVFDHFPTPGVRYVSRENPLASQLNCYEKPDRRCLGTHHKHPLFLWRRRGARIRVEPGFHQLWCRGEVLYEPTESLIMHHHPYRAEDVTRLRSERLAERGVVGTTDSKVDLRHWSSRMRSLDAIYRGDLASVVDHRTGESGMQVAPWDEGSRSARR